MNTKTPLHHLHAATESHRKQREAMREHAAHLAAQDAERQALTAPESTQAAQDAPTQG